VLRTGGRRKLRRLSTTAGGAMKVVIVAFANDNHTAPLKWALEQAGYEVVCWAGVSWKESGQAALSFHGDAGMVLGSHSLDPGDVVWVRRPNLPVPNPDVAAPDRAFASEEYRWFSLSVMYLLEHLPVRCVNPYSASRAVNNKAVQLCLAARNGLNIPETVMTNAPSAVRDAFKNNSRRKICKAFFPHIWKKEGSEALAVTETFELAAEDLPEDEVLTYAPAIYQEMIVKNYDVRTVLLGSSAYSFSLHTPNRALDWRQEVGQGHVTVESMATPQDVERAMLAFAREAGIEFGSFDFAVDQDGRWWFLEVNEEGQFLWLDEYNSEVRIQEKFLAFLTLPKGASREEIEKKQIEFPSWKDYRQSPQKEQVPEEVHLAAPILSVEP
jgi:glutathione synthase/RimK-type ligase-like ATP-grasp enzyme